MKYEITFAPEALENFRYLRAYDRAAVRDAINEHLKHEPTRLSKSRIKRLRDIAKPQYHLRMGDIRVFYDVHESEVIVLGIVSKASTDEWMRKRGIKS